MSKQRDFKIKEGQIFSNCIQCKGDIVRKGNLGICSKCGYIQGGFIK